MYEPIIFKGTTILSGTAIGSVLGTSVALSFWGGVDPLSGIIIDHHHPLAGQNLAGKILAMPSSRGSCSGSGVLLELMLKGQAPAALVFEREEDILSLGIIVGQEFLGQSIPAVRLDASSFAKLLQFPYATVTNDQIECWPILPTRTKNENELEYGMCKIMEIPPSLDLSALDHQLLDGSFGKAAQAAARVVIQMAVVQNATELIDITQAHIDGCIYTGPASLLFAQKLCSWNAKVRVPSSLNSISIDRIRWQSQGVDTALANPAGQLADAYIAMGANPTYTCAPYLLEDIVPIKGQQIVWAESNAVVFANSVLGARTIKCPDFLDICVALTGRAPNIGCHIAANRVARLEIMLSSESQSKIGILTEDDKDALFPLLGYLVGAKAENRMAIVMGLEDRETATEDRLKAFGAAFATTSSAPMFHIANITPEAL